MLKTAELDIYGKGLCHIDLKKRKKTKQQKKKTTLNKWNIFIFHQKCLWS